nr:MAG TPA: hypothetical protein [Caudoviricetes sp.]
MLISSSSTSRAALKSTFATARIKSLLPDARTRAGISLAVCTAAAACCLSGAVCSRRMV